MRSEEMTMNIENLKDPRHWIGYSITTGAIVAVAHFMGLHTIHTPWTNVLWIGGALIIADTINHNLKLQ